MLTRYSDPSMLLKKLVTFAELTFVNKCLRNDMYTKERQANLTTLRLINVVESCTPSVEKQTKSNIRKPLLEVSFKC